MVNNQRKEIHKKLVIIGASGHGKVVADIAEKMQIYESILFLDDNDSLKEIMGYVIEGKSSDAKKFYSDADFFVAIGNADIRKRIMETLFLDKVTFATLIHPNSTIGKNVIIGSGSVVMAGAVINADTRIGQGCIINTGATIDHECVIDDYVHISVGAHLAGNVRVYKKSWIGIGAVISNNIEICSECMIGAGAVVVKQIKEAGTYVGVPVRLISK